MNDTYRCKRCGSLCSVEDNFGEYICWCDYCDQEAEGFDSEYYQDEFYLDAISESYEELKTIQSEFN